MDKNYNPAKAENEIRQLWDDKDIFKFDENSSKPIFSIDTPPPTISGELHMGHMFSFSHADFIARYKRMRGYNVFYPLGVDNNGLPTEVLIERTYNVTSDSLGSEKFAKLVSDNIGKYKQNYVETFKKLGLSIDMKNVYETISIPIQKISQLSFIKLFEQGRVYKAEEPVLFCPKCKTVISQMELEDKEVESVIYTVKFGEIKIATTRPELLPACVAVFVNPEDSKYKGIVGKQIEVPLIGSSVKVYADSRVNPNFGTGAVMCCTFGDTTDIEWYKQYHLDLKIIIDSNGKLNYDFLKGLSIKAARDKIVEELKGKGLIEKEEKIKHNVNVHERCGTEIEFIVKSQWKVKYLDLKEKLIELGREVNWHPEFMRIRYENWVNGLKWDWNISRQRVWGIKFPVWYCKKCGTPKIAKESELPVDPSMSKPSEPCECGSTEFEPETDVMDTWATSSLTPLINARWGSKDNLMGKLFPMSLRPQGYDIIATWAFTTIVKSYLHTGSVPWKDIMLSGLGLDPHGRSIHKSLGNIIYPGSYFEKYGADTIRYWASGNLPGEDASFQEKEIIAASRLINKIWNVGRFIEMYKKPCIEYEPSYVDKLMLSNLNAVLKKVINDFENFDYFNARNSAEELFWEFANDYLEIIKQRIYNHDTAALCVLAKIFLNILKLLAPIIPFSTEYIYQQLFIANKELLGKEEAEVSIHITKLPEYNPELEDLSEAWSTLASTVHYIRKWKHQNELSLNTRIKSIKINEKYRKQLESALEDIKNVAGAENAIFGETGEEQCIIER
jgi:valyl-tRNA synthetase